MAVNTEMIRSLLQRSGVPAHKIDAFLKWAEENALFGSIITSSTPTAELVAMASSPMVTALGAAQVRMSAPSAWGESGELDRQAAAGTCGCSETRLCPGHAKIRNGALA